jgi:protein transport protein SEC31
VCVFYHSQWFSLSPYSDVILTCHFRICKDSGGTGFEDYGGELDLYNLNIGGESPILLKTVKTSNRFGSLAWSPNGQIAGGMSDGTVLIWSFKELIDDKEESCPVVTASSHKAEVKALAFSPLNHHQLASGSSDGQVTITDLSSATPTSQTLGTISHVEVVKISWNTQVEHIVAVAHADGLVVVWDLKQKKPWCQLRSPEAISDIQWNPTEGLHLLTASLDDRNPIIKLWDLRASTSMPLTALSGHSQGILSIDWCPHDDTLLARCV